MTTEAGAEFHRRLLQQARDGVGHVPGIAQDDDDTPTEPRDTP